MVLLAAWREGAGQLSLLAGNRYADMAALKIPPDNPAHVQAGNRRRGNPLYHACLDRGCSAGTVPCRRVLLSVPDTTVLVAHAARPGINRLPNAAWVDGKTAGPAETIR